MTALGNGYWAIISETWANGVPGLRLRLEHQPSSSIASLAGLEVSYRVTDRRVCLGHTTFDDAGRRYVDCERPVERSARCERCTTVENVFAASMHQAHKLGRAYVDQRQAAHLDQPHRLYLAAFGDGTIKVGTTAGASGGVRLAEQGAWHGVYVATTTDGYRIRDLEDAVTEQLGITQAVSVSRKLRGHLHPCDSATLNGELERCVADVHRLIAELLTDDLGQAGVEPTSTPWSNPSLDDARWAGALGYPNRLDRGQHHLIIVDVIGKVALIERPSSADRFVADLGQLSGLVIEVGDMVPDAVEVQASLF